MTRFAKSIEQTAIDALIPYARNSRTHSEAQVAQIAASIREFGFTNPVLVDGDGGIIAGHGRVLAARKLGLETVPTIRIDYMTEAQKRAYIIADNKLALNAGWDEELLALELGELADMGFDLGLTGFSEGELAGLRIGPADEVEGLTDEDEVPEPLPNPVSVVGDVWQLGPHRVMCGDSTDEASVFLLLEGQHADMVFTDPPYGVSYADKNETLNKASKGNRIQTEIMNDHLQGDALGAFFLAIFSTMAAVMKPGCPFYVCAPQGGEQMMMMMMMMKAGIPMRHELIWIKNNHVLGRADYHYKHEPILYGWKDGAGHPWYGGRDKVSTWHVDKPMQSKLHPTMKPVELVEIALENSSKRGDTVLDLFGGSGTTLIACERTGRTARLMELDPKYADVIVRRWQDFTGQQATLEATGQTFEELEGERLQDGGEQSQPGVNG
jgi:DNA modification methylase